MNPIFATKNAGRGGILRQGVWGILLLACMAQLVFTLINVERPASKRAIRVDRLTALCQQLFILGLGKEARVLLRPEHAIAGKLAVACYLVRDGELRPWTPEVHFYDTGSIGLRGVLENRMEPGHWDLVVALGRAGKLPDSAHLETYLRHGGEWLAHDFTIVRQSLLLKRL